MRLVRARILSVDAERKGLQRLTARAEGEDGERGERRAYCLPTLTGRCAEGDRVVLNVTATGLDLGTGGWDFVAMRGWDGTDAVLLDEPSAGHIMKLRYTPLQHDVLAVEERESPHHEVLSDADSASGLPVVACPLHSHLPVAAAAVKELAPSTRVVYVMTDDASLPLALSETVAACVEAGLVDRTVTCGQAFGGDLEAVNVYSGLLAAARVASADVAIVSIGPGVAGTGTRFGHGGVAQGAAINAAATLGAVPVASLRLSQADRRDRHRGLSRHSAVALGEVALAEATIALPAHPEEWLRLALEEAGLWERHRPAEATRFAEDLPDTRGVRLESMGRTPEDDPVFFRAAAWAGEVAAGLALERSSGM